MGRRAIADALGISFLAAMGLTVALPRYLDGIDFGDEGVLAYGALRVLEGELPNRDFFTLYPPLSFHVVASVFGLLGTTLASLRTLGVAIYLAHGLLVYAVARRVATPVIAVAAALPAIGLGLPLDGFVPTPAWHGATAALLAAWLLLGGSSSGKLGWMFAAGVATAVTGLFRHDQGVLLATAIAAYLVGVAALGAKSRACARRERLAWCFGLVLVIAPVSIYWLAAGAARPMLRQIVLHPLLFYGTSSSIPMPGWVQGQPLGLQLLTILFYLPPIATLTALALLLVRRRRLEAAAAPDPLSGSIAFIAVLTFLFWCQVLSRSDIYHLLPSLGPFFALCGVLLESAARATGARRREGDSTARGRAPTFGYGLVLLVATGLGGWVWWEIHPLVLRPPLQDRADLDLERGGVFVERQRAAAIQATVAVIRANASPADSIFCLPSHPMTYFLAERRNATRWDYLWPGDQTEDEHRELVEQLRRDPPRVVLLVGASFVAWYTPIVVRYLKQEYRALEDIPQWWLVPWMTGAAEYHGLANADALRDTYLLVPRPTPEP